MGTPDNTISKNEQPQTFTFVRDGVPEKVEPERWRWIARYRDGSVLKQFDEETGLFHQFKEIDQSRLDAFTMMSEDVFRRKYTLHFADGMRLIHYYRNTVLNAGTDEEVRFKAYCFGYAETIEGRSRKTILQIYPDESCEIVSDDGRE